MVSVVDPDLVGSESTSTKCTVKPHFFAENFNIVSELFENDDSYETDEKDKTM
jgi:hypothetical protein